MISVEFMTGALLLSSLQIALLVFTLWVIWRLFNKVQLHLAKEKPLKIKFELGYLFITAIFSVYIGTAGQPKLKLDVPTNRALIEYQSGEEVVIETPALRTETLDGFTPLKE